MPGIVEYRRSCTIDIGSTASQIPCLLLTMYGPTQKFVEKFSRELNTEYSGGGMQGTNITVQCVMPGFVATKMSKLPAPRCLSLCYLTHLSSLLCRPQGWSSD